MSLSGFFARFGSLVCIFRLSNTHFGIIGKPSCALGVFVFMRALDGDAFTSPTQPKKDRQVMDGWDQTTSSGNQLAKSKKDNFNAISQQYEDTASPSLRLISTDSTTEEKGDSDDTNSSDHAGMYIARWTRAISWSLARQSPDSHNTSTFQACGQTPRDRQTAGQLLSICIG